MSKPIILRIENGSFKTGFEVRVSIPLENGPPRDIKGQFPSDAGVEQAYKNWQNACQTSTIQRQATRITVSNLPISPSTIDPADAAQSLREALNQWFSCLAIHNIELQIELQVRQDTFRSQSRRGEESQSIHLLLQTENLELQKLPWHLWNLVANSNSGTLTLILESNPIQLKPFVGHPKILVVLGAEENKINRQIHEINVQTDLDIVNQLGHKTVSLPRPTRKELIDKLQSEQWDILIFAGHSSSKQFVLGTSENPVFPDELREPLREAVSKGLKLVIFNSCDGLRLAHQVLRIGIPYVIAMRSSIPDELAHVFLKSFGQSFFKERFPLHIAVNHARRELVALEGTYPGASWMPVLYRNSGAPDSFVLPSNILIFIQRLIRNAFRILPIVAAISGVLSIIVAYRILISTNPCESPTSGLGSLSISDPDVILYKEKNAQGESLHINALPGNGIRNIGFADGEGNGDETTFNDEASSIRILRGKWLFFTGQNYDGDKTRPLEPGNYNFGANNNKITSACRVS